MTAVSLFKVWYLLVYLQFSPIGAYDKYEIYQGKKQIATLEVTKDEIFNNSGKMLSFSYTENGVAQEYSVLVGFNSNVFLKSIKQGTNVILADNSKIQLNNFEYDTLHTDILIDIDSKELAKNKTSEATILKVGKSKLNVTKNVYSTTSGNLTIYYTEDGLSKCEFTDKDKIKTTILRSN